MTAPLPPHPLPGLAVGRRTLYARASDDGRVFSRAGRWSTELRDAELRARAREFDVLQRLYGGTVWRVQLTLQAPALAKQEEAVA